MAPCASCSDQALLHGLDRGVQLLGELPQPGLGLVPLGERLAEREQVHDLAAQGGEGGLLLRGEGARDAVNDAQGAEGVSVRGDQRRPRVETDAGVARDERVVGEARVGPGVGDEHQVRLQDRVGAEGDVAGRLAHVQSDDALEPLAALVNERDGGDGDAADLGRQQRDVVEGQFRGRVQDIIRPQRVQAGAFSGGERSGQDNCSFGRLP